MKVNKIVFEEICVARGRIGNFYTWSFGKGVKPSIKMGQSIVWQEDRIYSTICEVTEVSTKYKLLISIHTTQGRFKYIFDHTQINLKYAPVSVLKEGKRIL